MDTNGASDADREELAQLTADLYAACDRSMVARNAWTAAKSRAKEALRQAHFARIDAERRRQEAVAGHDMVMMTPCRGRQLLVPLVNPAPVINCASCCLLSEAMTAIRAEIPDVSAIDARAEAALGEEQEAYAEYQTAQRLLTEIRQRRHALITLKFSGIDELEKFDGSEGSTDG